MNMLYSLENIETKTTFSKSNSAQLKQKKWQEVTDKINVRNPAVTRNVPQRETFCFYTLSTFQNLYLITFT